MKKIASLCIATLLSFAAVSACAIPDNSQDGYGGEYQGDGDAAPNYPMLEQHLKPQDGTAGAGSVNRRATMVHSGISNQPHTRIYQPAYLANFFAQIQMALRGLWRW